MFGSVPGASVVHDETSALNPQSPYAAAKAAAHLLCRATASRTTCASPAGSSSTTSRTAAASEFLTRKVVDHLLALRAGGERRRWRSGT